MSDASAIPTIQPLPAWLEVPGTPSPAGNCRETGRNTLDVLYHLFTGDPFIPSPTSTGLLPW